VVLLNGCDLRRGGEGKDFHGISKCTSLHSQTVQFAHFVTDFDPALWAPSYHEPFSRHWCLGSRNTSLLSLWNCWDLVTSSGWPGEFQEVGLSWSCQGSCDAEFSEATSLEAHSYRGSPSSWKSICVISKAFLQILPSMNYRHQVVKHARSGNVQTLGPRLIWAWIMLAFRWRLVTMITFDAGGLQQLGSTHFC
jgi:hypothetical protein